MLSQENRIRQLSAPNDTCKCIETSVNRNNAKVSFNDSHNYVEWRKDGLNSIKYHIHNEYVDKFGAKWIEVSNKPYLTKNELRQFEMTDTSSPIVVPKYRLIFFFIQKSASTYWRRILQYMQNINVANMYTPGANKLMYLR
jgi:hypothetical protein